MRQLHVHKGERVTTLNELVHSLISASVPEVQCFILLPFEAVHSVDLIKVCNFNLEYFSIWRFEEWLSLALVITASPLNVTERPKVNIEIEPWKTPCKCFSLHYSWSYSMLWNICSWNSIIKWHNK